MLAFIGLFAQTDYFPETYEKRGSQTLQGYQQPQEALLACSHNSQEAI